MSLKAECESWFSEWFSATSPEIIEKVNRGPMKAVMDHLVKRAKTDKAIEVMRSNLYVEQKRTKMTEPEYQGLPAQEKLKILENWARKEERLIRDVEENMKKLYALDATAHSFSATMEKRLFIGTMRENLAIISGFVQDVNEIKRKGSVTSEERLTTLNALLEEALQIFQEIFFRRGGLEPNQLDWRKIEEIIPSILCAPEYARDVQRWNNSSRRLSEEKIQKRLRQMSRCVQPNPLAEWDNLVNKKLFTWTQCHVQLHWKNTRLAEKRRILAMKKKDGQIMAMETCRQLRSLSPDFCNLLLRREELKFRLRFCRHISSQNTISIWSDGGDIENAEAELGNEDIVDAHRRSLSNKRNLYKTGTTEDMAVCLMKGWHNTKSKLLSTQERVRQTFPEVLLPAVTALLDHTHTAFNCNTKEESSSSHLRDLSHIVSPKGSDQSASASYDDMFPSANVDLNPAISLEEDLRNQSLKIGSSTADILRSLLMESTSAASSFL